MRAFFARLRDETASEHARLETLLAIMSPSLGRGRYLQILRMFLAYVEPYEQQLWQKAPAHLHAACMPRRGSDA